MVNNQVFVRRLIYSIRLALIGVLLFFSYLAAARGIAFHYYRKASIHGLRVAISWDPANPLYYSTLGHLLLHSSDDSKPEDIIELFTLTTSLNPGSARNWADLGSAYEWAGMRTESQEAYEFAHTLFPQSSIINWQMANYYLRNGNLRNAFNAFQIVLVHDPSLRLQIFRLAASATKDQDMILREMIPSDLSILLEYLKFLSNSDRLDDAEGVWAHILNLGSPINSKPAIPFINALLRGGRVEQATEAWKRLSRTGQEQEDRSVLSSNRLTNGSFEKTILNGGLGWRVSPARNVRVVLSNLVFFDGTRSIKIQFGGQDNINYHHLHQLVPVSPNTEYRFTGYMRTRNITTDSGPRFYIIDAYNPSQLSISTEQILGDTDWSSQQLKFHTGPETRLIIIRVARFPSRKIDNRISGTLWVDRLRLLPSP